MATKKPKTKKKSSKKSSNIFNKSAMFYINSAIIITIFILVLLLVNILFFNENTEIPENYSNPTKELHENKTNSNINNTFQESTQELEIQYVKSYVPKEELHIIKKPTFHFDTIENNNSQKTIINKTIEPKAKKNKPVLVSNKPKLAILIDDVASKHQLNKVNKLPFKASVAFLPPTSAHKQSAIIAQNQEGAIIHLPLEASSKKFEEKNTLYITDSLATIDARIKYIKKIYPNIKYINNHTGSKFTSNLQAMDKLAKTLKKYDYYFLDSRTIANTKIKQVAKKYDLPYLSRDIFLDNTKKKSYIKKQLKKAVRIAKTTGSAIAIGHPYPITFETLNEVQNIIKDVDLVYIHELKIVSPNDTKN
jgi:polysaccharide deacetylase 2 family uncharacterized protein YibQ